MFHFNNDSKSCCQELIMQSMQHQFSLNVYIHTYKHTYIIVHYNPLVRIMAKLLTPLMMYVLILYVSGGTYSLTSTSNDRFF